MNRKNALLGISMQIMAGAAMAIPSPAFAQWQAERINPAPDFYVRPPPKVLDVCLAPVPARVSLP